MDDSYIHITQEFIAEISPNISEITSIVQLRALITSLFFYILAQTMTPTEAAYSFLSRIGGKVELFSR